MNTISFRDSGCPQLAAVSLFIFLSIAQSSVSGEQLPANADGFKAVLEAGGWKSFPGSDGALYLYPPGHPYAYLDQRSDGKWSDIPPPGSKALSTIVHMLELQGYFPIVEIEFEGGLWEVEAYRHGEPVEFKVDPVNAEISADRSEND